METSSVLVDLKFLGKRTAESRILQYSRFVNLTSCKDESFDNFMSHTRGKGRIEEDILFSQWTRPSMIFEDPKVFH